MANGGRIDFTVGLKTDKTSLNQVNRALQAVQDKLDSAQGKVPSGLKQAANAAKQLQDIMQKAWNPQIGEFNLTKVNAEIQKTYGSVFQMSGALKRGGQEGQQAFDAVASSILNTKLQIRESNQLLNEMADTFGKTVKYGIASSVFNTLKGTLQQAFYYAKDLDLSLTDIRIVTGDSADQMERFAKTANSAAQELGRSTLDYTKAALTFYQQGLNDNEVQERASNVLKAQNITGAGSEMADKLTAVWNGFNVSAEETTLYVDKLAAVADHSASNMSQLATAMSKVASTANSLGVDADQLTAQISTIIATTRQAPESVGTALKTIYARINDIKTGADDAEISLGKYSEKMAALGFSVLDANGRLKDTGTTMEEIGNSWASLSREQQIYLAQTMAGTRQYNNLIALFDNWTKYSDMLNVSLEAQGTLNQKNSIYLESVKAHMQELSTETERTYQILSDTKALNSIVDIMKGALDSFNDFIEGLGGGRTVLLNFVSQFANLFSNQIGKAINDQIKNIQRFRDSLNAEKLKKDLIQVIQWDAKITGRNTSVEKQAEIAQKILNIRKSLTQEQYNELTDKQKLIGEAQRQLEILEKQSEEYDKQYQLKTDENGAAGSYIQVAEATQQNIKQLEEQKQLIKDSYQYYNQLGEEGIDFKQIQDTIKNTLISSQNVLKEGMEAEEDKTILTRQQYEVLQSLSKKAEAGTLSAKQLEKVYQLQNTALQKQKELKQDLLNAADTEIKKAEKQNAIEAGESSIDSAVEQVQRQQKIADAVRITSAAVQGATAVIGGLKTAFDESATAAERFNGQFAALSGGAAAIANVFAPGSGILVQGIANLVKEVGDFFGWWDGWIDDLTTAEQRLEGIRETQKKASQETQSFNSSKKEIESIAEEWEKLVNKSGHFTEEEQNRYNQIAELLNKYNEDIIDGYSAQHDAIVTNQNAVKDTLKLLDEEYQKKMKVLYADNPDASALDINYQNEQKRLDKAKEQYDTYSGVDIQFIKDRIDQVYSDAFGSGLHFVDKNGNNNIIAATHIGDQVIQTINSITDELKSAKDIKQILEIYNESNSLKYLNEEDQLFWETFLQQIKIPDEVLEELNQAQSDYDKAEKIFNQQNFTIDPNILLGGLQHDERRQGYQEYQKLKNYFGDLWEQFGKDLTNQMITRFVEPMRFGTGQGQYASDEEVYAVVAQYEQSLFDLLDPKSLQQIRDKKIKLLEKESEYTANDYELAQRQLIQSFIDKNQAIQEALKQQDNSNIVNFLQSFFDIEELEFNEKNKTQIQNFLTENQNFIKERLDDFENRIGKFTHQQLRTKNFLTQWLQSLSPEDLEIALKGLNNIDISKIVDDTQQLTKNILEAGYAAKDLEVNLAWDDKVKIINNLSKKSSLNSIDGAKDFLTDLEQQYKQLQALALSESGRYSEDYIKKLTEILETKQQENISNKEEEIQKKEQYLLELESKKREILSKYKDNQIINTEDAQRLSSIEIQIDRTKDNIVAKTTELVELNSQLAQLNQEETEQLSEQLKQIEAYNTKLSQRENLLSASKKIGTDQSFTDDELLSLAKLEQSSSALSALSSDRHSEAYKAQLEIELELLRQQLEQEKEITLQNYDLQIQKAKQAEDEEEVNRLLLERIKLQQEDFALLQQKNKTISQFKETFASLQEKLMSQNEISKQTTEDLTAFLDELIQKYPQLQSEAEFLKNTWLAGTDQYKAALEDLKTALDDISIQQTYEELSELFNETNIELTVQLSDEEYQDWKNDVEDFFAKDRQLSVSIDNMIKDELKQVEDSISQVYNAAGKIGQNFIVAASDIEQVLKVFPEITQGMQLLDNGSYQLSQNMVQYALGAAQGDVEANAKAVIEKLEQQAAFHDAKAEIYHQIAEASARLASGEVADEQTQAQLRSQIVDGLGQLQITNANQLQEELAKAKDAEVTNSYNAAQMEVDDQKTAGVAMVENAWNVADQKVEAQAAELDTKINNAATAGQAEIIAQSTGEIPSYNLARTANGRKAPMPAVNPPMLSSRRSVPRAQNTADPNSLSNSLANYLPSDFQDINNFAAAREEQERQAAAAARASIAAIQARLQQLAFGLGNVARGQGIEGAKPEKPEKESSPSSGRSPSGGSDKPTKEDAGNAETPQAEGIFNQINPGEWMALLESQVDIYHEINIQLDKIARSLTNIQKQQQKLVGKQLVASYQQQLDLLNKQVATQEYKLELAKGQAQALQKQLSSQFGLTFDEETGQMYGYTQALAQREDALNSFIAYYRTLTKEQQQASQHTLDSYQREYDDIKNLMDKYEELAYNTIPELEDAIQDTLDQKVALKIKAFKISVDAYINLDQLKKDYNNFKKTVVKQIREDDILGNAQFDMNMAQRLLSPNYKSNPIRKEAKTIKEIIQQIEDIKNTGTSSIYGNDMATALEDLNHYRETLQGTLQDMWDTVKNIKQSIFDAINQVEEGYEKRQDYYKSISDLLNHDAKVIQLIYGDKAYSAMNNIYSKQFQYDKQHLADLNEERRYWLKKLQDQQKHQKTLEQGSNVWKESQDRIQAYEKNWQTSVSKMNSALESSIQNIISKYTNTINQIYDNLQKKMTGGKNFQSLREEWQAVKKNADSYLDDVNSAFEIQKLRSRYQDTIKNNKGNIKAQKELNSLMEYQISYLQDKEKLTKYDVDRANALLNIEAKRLELENTAQNKSKLRLRRDSQGNYSYQYTTDANDVQAKRVELLELQNNLYNMTKDAYNQSRENILKAEEEMLQAYSKIDLAVVNHTMTEEQAAERKKIIYDNYLSYIETVSQDAKKQNIDLVSTAYASLLSMSEQSQIDTNTKLGEISAQFFRVLGKDGEINGYYKENYENVEDWMVQNKDAVARGLEEIKTGPYAQGAKDFEDMVYNDTNGLVPTWQVGINKLIEIVGDNSENGFRGVINTAMTQVTIAATEYKDELDALGEAAKVNFDKIYEGIDTNITKTYELKTTNDELITSYQDVAKEIENMIRKLEYFIKDYQKLQDLANSAVSEAYNTSMRAEMDATGSSSRLQDNPGSVDSQPAYNNIGWYYLRNVNTGQLQQVTAEQLPNYQEGNGWQFVNYEQYKYGNMSVPDKEFWDNPRRFGVTDWFWWAPATGEYARTPETQEAIDDKYYWGWIPIDGKAFYNHSQENMQPFIDAFLQDPESHGVGLGADGRYHYAYDTGGYTGNWDSNNGKWALLHQKELVLNKQDTQNILKAVAATRDFSGILNSLVTSHNLQNSNLGANSLSSPVYITADFPSVTSSKEIEKAFENLMNQASQYIYRNKY